MATLERVLEEAFTKMPYAMEDFLDHGYGTVSDPCILLPFFLLRHKFDGELTMLCLAQLMDTETKRKIKKEPALAVEMRSDIFAVADGGEAEGAAVQRSGDVVSELWAF